MDSTSLATVGETAWLSVLGLALVITDRPGPTTCCTRYGYIRVPWFAMAAENMASWNGLTASLNCPIAEKAVSDGSVQPLTSGSTLGTTGTGIDSFLFMPNKLE